MIGRKLAGRYEVLSELGRGGMGVVYLAHDPLLSRDVAIKLVTAPELPADLDERFRREARMVAKMDHPAIVSVFDIGEHDQALFYVMPVVRGANLRTLLHERALSIADVVEIGIQAAEALDYSHARQVVHRDIKPENLLVTREESGRPRLRITDFGLAATTAAASRLTQSGALVGTVAYLSPEQVAGGAADARSDLYALGTVLYECLAGEPPFTGETQAVLYRITHDQPSPLAPPELSEVILWCLSKSPAARPQRGRDLAEALVRLRARLEPGLRPSGGAHDAVRSTFAGREKELGELSRRLNAAMAGECQLALLGGDAGVGKSRLLAELESIARGRGVPVLHGRFVEHDRSLPFQGFCEVILEHLRLAPEAGLGDLAPELAASFAALAELADTPRPPEPRRLEDRTFLFELLARTFIRVHGGNPLLVLLEDLHEAEVSAEALQYVVRRLGPSPVLFVATYRTRDVTRRHPVAKLAASFEGDRRAAHLVLSPLDEAEDRAYLAMLIGSSELSPRLVSRIHEATDGNPYFTKELVRSLVDTGAVHLSPDGTWDLVSDAGPLCEALPASIQEAVRARLSRLPPEHLDLLAQAAVLGRSFEFRDLAAISAGAPLLAETLEQLVTAGFLEEERGRREDRYAFPSAMVRDVLGASLPRRRRRALHRAFGEELERRHAADPTRVAPRLLHHFAEGDVPEKVVRYGLALAESALLAFTPEEALRAATTVLDFLGDDAGLVEAHARTLLAGAHRMLESVDPALQELEAAARLYEEAEEPGRALTVIARAAETAWEKRRVAETRRWIARGLDVARRPSVPARERSDPELAKLLALAATVANLAGEYDAARAYLAQAKALEPRDEGDSFAGGDVSVALTNPVRATHPAEIRIDEDQEVLANVFQTLVTTDVAGHLTPLLAERWQMEEGGRSFLFTLRSEAALPGENGRQRRLTAHDVALALRESIQRGARALPQGLAVVSGAAGGGPLGLEVVSDSELRIRLEEPLPIYPALLTDISTAIALPAVARHFEGTGRFRLDSITATEVVLKSSPVHWSGEPAALDTLVFRSGLSAAEMAQGLRSGELDVARDLPPELLDEVLRDRRLRPGLAETPKRNVAFALFASSSAAGANEGLRRALFGVVRTRDLVLKALGRSAQPAECLYPPGILGHDPGRRRQALTRDEALSTLRDAGVTLPLRLRALVHPILQDRYAALVSELVATWADLAVFVECEPVSMETYLARHARPEGVDLLLARWNADYPDPDDFSRSLFHSSAGYFRRYFSSSWSDAVLAAARSEARPSERERLYRDFEDMLLSDAVLLPLFHELDHRVAGPKVRHLKLSAAPPYVHYHELMKSSATASSLLRKRRRGVVQVPITGSLPSLDPATIGTVVQGQVVPAVFETLTRQCDGPVVPWLARELLAEDGGRRFRVTLRDDVRFHDGRMLSSRDVRYSFERLLQGRSSGRWLLAPIKGAREILAGDSRELTGLTIVSATEFQVELERPLSFFPAVLASHPTAIVPEGAASFTGEWRDGCVGTGPYRVARHEVGRQIAMEANPHYWRPGVPHNEGLTFTLEVPPADVVSGFRSGRYSLAWDLFPEDVDALRRDSRFAPRYREVPRLGTYFLAFNTRRGPLADVRVRKALVRGLDLAGLLRRRLGRLAIPAEGLIPPGLLGHEPEARVPEPASTATQISGNRELVGVLHSVFAGPYAAFADALLGAFQQRGMAVRVRRDVHAEGLRPTDEDADFVLHRWMADYPDADSFYSGLLHTERGVLGGITGSPELDAAIDRARAEGDTAARHAQYRRLEERVAEERLVLPLFHEQAYRFARPELLGFSLNFFSPIVAYEKLAFEG